MITEQPLKLSRMVQDGSHIHEKVAECIQTQIPKNALGVAEAGEYLELREGAHAFCFCAPGVREAFVYSQSYDQKAGAWMPRPEGHVEGCLPDKRSSLA